MPNHPSGGSINGILYRSIFLMFVSQLIGACSSRGMSREINLISQCDKFNIAPPAWKPKITLSRRTNCPF